MPNGPEVIIQIDPNEYRALAEEIYANWLFGRLVHPDEKISGILICEKTGQPLIGKPYTYRLFHEGKEIDRGSDCIWYGNKIDS